MPLVTRKTGQANLFKEDTEPPNWQDADLWAKSGVDPARLFINNAGTALEI